jgi:hypothetical protein
MMKPVDLPKVINIVLREIRRRIYCDEAFTMYQFDLTKAFAMPVPCIPLTVRPLEDKDIPKLLAFDESDIDSQDLRCRLERLMLIKADIPRCYVGVTSNDDPCVMCWLMDHEANDRIQSYFKGGLLRLQPGEVLCENIFTHKSYRNMQLMQYLTFQLFEIASRSGAHKAFAYIHSNNTVSMNAARSIGWEPCGVKKVRWRCFRRRIEWSSLPNC